MKPPNNITVEDILVQHNYVSQADIDEARKVAPPGKIVDYLLSQKNFPKIS